MPRSYYLARRQIIMDFIQDYLAEHHHPPTARQLSLQSGWSLSVCQRYLMRLRLDGLLPPPQPGRSLRYTLFHDELLSAIQQYTAQHGYAPSLRNLAGIIGLSPNTLRRYLDLLSQEGLLDYTPGVPRSLRLIK